MKFTKGTIVFGHAPFTLEHMNFHRSLVVSRSGKDFTFSRRNGRVALDELGKNPAQGFNPQ